MFEPLESRQFFSVAPMTPVSENQTAPAPVEQSVSADNKKGSTKSSGLMFLSFTFKLIAVKTISWAHD